MLRHALIKRMWGVMGPLYACVSALSSLLSSAAVAAAAAAAAATMDGLISTTSMRVVQHHQDAATLIQLKYQQHSLCTRGESLAVFMAAKRQHESITIASLAGLVLPALTVYLVSCLVVLLSFSNQ